MTARNIGYRNMRHHVRLMTKVVRWFSPLAAKCDGFHCQTGQENSYGMHFRQF